MKERAAERHRKDEITTSEAASLAGLTIQEVEQYPIREGYRSDCSIADPDRERERLRSNREG